MENRKPFILGIVGLITFAVIWYYMNHITYTDATASKVNVLLLYSSTHNSGESKLNIVIKPVKSKQKISAFKVVLTGDRDVQFVDVGEPLSPESNVPFSRLEKTVTQTTTKISYVVTAADAALPSMITIPVSYIGRGKITFNTTSSQVAGNIPQNVYTFGKVDVDY